MLLISRVPKVKEKNIHLSGSMKLSEKIYLSYYLRSKSESMSLIYNFSDR